ncbi:MAG: M14 family metallopeptidase [Thioalkalispiraceae bacterium]|jgi:succinylglutamate desuccinylase
MLTVYGSLPEGLLECDSTELHKVLPGPSLIHLPGKQAEPLFVSVILHGNESTGWLAIREVLKHYTDKALPRALSIFIGNVQAARKSARHLDGQPDYNRIWKANNKLDEDDMVREILEQMEKRNVFASIDIHNNSGHNPHYACINRLATPFFQLATMFSNTVVYFLKPDTVQSMAFANLCPAVTVECGKPGDSHGTEHARDFVLSTLALRHFDEDSQDIHDLNVFHTVVTVKLKQGLSVGMEGEDCALQLLPEIDYLNFTEIEIGRALARVREPDYMPVQAMNEFGKDVADRYFEIREGILYTTVKVMPSMLTLDMDIIRKDCLCYLMERLDLSTTLST